MNKLLKIFVAILFVCSCGEKKTSELVIETETGDIVYNVEVADTVKDLEIGLMDRETLPADGGMLFDLSVVPNKVTAMWMKDTKLSLDMLFLTKEGVIYWLKEKAQPYSEELIIAPFPAAAVLELNAGDIAKHKIKSGQRVKHPLFKPAEHATLPAITEKEDEIVADKADMNKEDADSNENAVESNDETETIEAEETVSTENAESVVIDNVAEEATTEVSADKTNETENVSE